MNMLDYPGYTLLRQIAEGGMATLYLASDVNGHRVVLRALKPEFNHDRRIRRGFINSGNLLTSLRHHNIVRILGTVHTEGPTPFMILEYIDGANLREHILQRAPLLTHKPLSLIRQMATALHYLHRHHLLHMDFKPENLILDNEERVVLVDFDLAVRTHGRRVFARRIPGTPAYVAPEVLLHHRIDERADIYSFGVTCFEMLMNLKPYENTVGGRTAFHLFDPSVHEWNAGLKKHPPVPRRLRVIIHKCLARNHDCRYPSFSLILKDLESII